MVYDLNSSLAKEMIGGQKYSLEVESALDYTKEYSDGPILNHVVFCNHKNPSCQLDVFIC